ncbi:hypothetical protein QBC40DRAFT_91677 [Triangularia verruculosa]|uniref:Secreted protein n=1 Tax=Triangularia verruculosa TaxID=2587418 RepID=A0AAN6XVS0_9PEZI|nr:hypothetical protein QBC40DRAFT_91677 [Triangularia verruculosa]
MKYSIIFVAAIGLASAAPAVNQLNRPNGAVARRSAPSSNNGPTMNYVRKRSPQSEGGQSSGNTSGGGSNDGGSNRDSVLSGTTIASEGSVYSDQSQQSQSSTGETLVNPPSTPSQSTRSSQDFGSDSGSSDDGQRQYEPITPEMRQNLLNNIRVQQQQEAAEEEQWRQQRDAITRAASGSAGESSGQSGRPNNGGNNDGAGGAGGGKVSSK